MSKRSTEFLATVRQADAAANEKNMLKTAKRLIDEQAHIIQGLTTPPRSAIPKPARKNRRARKTHIRLVFGDLHGASHDPAAVAAFLRDVETLKPAEIICLGDLIDCGGFLAEHHTWGYTSEMDYTYTDDIHAAALLLDAIAPHTEKIYYIEGNHERRVEKFAITTALRSRSDQALIRDSLLKTLAPEHLLQLQARGITHIKQGTVADDVATPATLRLGKSLYCHTGFERGGGGSAVALKHLARFSDNIAFAHTHQPIIQTSRVAGTGDTIIARNYGCLCKLQPLWHHGDPTNWAHGYGLEIVRPDGTFLAFYVPIVNGTSLLQDFAALIQT